MTVTTPFVFYSVKAVEGRSFIIRYPYAGPDAVVFEIYPGCNKGCKILGFAKRGSLDRTISEQEAQKIMVEDD